MGPNQKPAIPEVGVVVKVPTAFSDNSASSQRSRMLQWFQGGRSLTTLEDFLPKKQNPEPVAASSGAKQEHESHLDNSNISVFDQGVSPGGGQ